MTPMDRRRFLLTAAATATLPSLRSFAEPSPQTVAVTLHADKPGPTIPANFVGVSFETQQLADPGFFTAANHGLIAQFRALSPNGVLRLGGNTSDYGFWKPTPTSVMPPRTPRPFKVGDPDPNTSYAVTPLAVRNLKAFLDATGWTCLYGINLGTNIPSLAADEALFVFKTLGTKLEYFQVGNEADRFASTIRDPLVTGEAWNADAFFDEWLTFADAIRQAVPGARFGMPDIASNAEWFSTITTRLNAMPEGCCPNPSQACGCAEAIYDPKRRPHIACLSHHYYIDGPPSNPAMTIDRILHTDPKVAHVASIVRDAATTLHTTYRMTEGNTCYRGGKPGVSDVFASALWSADYLLSLASLGYAGVNLHGGDGQMVANSLGGKLPGDELVIAAHGDPATHPHPYYTPIAHIPDTDTYVLEPVAFGMKFAGHFAGATILPIDFDPGTVNATAYAARRKDGKKLIAVINKDATQTLHLTAMPSLVVIDKLSAPSTASDPLAARSATLARVTKFNYSIPPATAILFGSLGL